MKNGIELEIKLAAGSEAELARAAADERISSGRRSGTRILEMRSEYYSLCGGGPEAKNASLRFRSENGKGRVSVKMSAGRSGGCFRRKEWEVSADSVEKGVELLRKVPELAPVFEGAAPIPAEKAQFRRAEFECEFEGALMCIALDSGWLESPENTFFEMEAEYAGGNKDALLKLSEYLTGKYSLTCENRSKRERCREFRLLHTAQNAHDF